MFKLNLSFSESPIIFRSNNKEFELRKKELIKKVISIYKENDLFIPFHLYHATLDDISSMLGAVIKYREEKDADKIKLSNCETLVDQYESITKFTDEEVLKKPLVSDEFVRVTSSIQNTDLSIEKIISKSEPEEEFQRVKIYDGTNSIKQKKGDKIDYRNFELDPLLTDLYFQDGFSFRKNQVLMQITEKQPGIGSLTSGTTFGVYGTKSNYLANIMFTNREPLQTEPDQFPHGCCYVLLAHPEIRPSYSTKEIFLTGPVLQRLKREKTNPNLLFLHLFKTHLHISHLPVLQGSISCPIKADYLIRKLEPIISGGQAPSYTILFKKFTEIHNELMLNSMRTFETKSSNDKLLEIDLISL